jgi:O-antigen/teichoic acid export membrane protein
VVAPKFVPWFFGDNYDNVSVLIAILSFLIIAIGISNVTGMQYLIPTKRQNIFTLTVLIGAVVNFVMNSVLINLFESIGAAIASVTAEIIIAIVQLIIVRKELKPLRVVKEGIHYYIAGGIMAIVLLLVAKLFTASIAGTLALVIIGAGVYFVLLLIMKDEFLLFYLNL